MVLPRNIIKVVLKQPLIHDHVWNLQRSEVHSSAQDFRKYEQDKTKMRTGSRSMYLFTKEDLRVIGDGFNEPQLKIFWCKFEPISLSFLQDPAQPNPNSAISRSIKMA